MATVSRRYRTILKSVLEVIPDVYQLTIGAVNVMLIAQKELTLIDAGYPGSSTQVIDLIRKLGRSEREIKLVIITHNHVDHVGGLPDLRKLTGARVAAHQADVVDVENPASYPKAVRKLLQTPLFSGLRPFFSAEPGEGDIQLVGGELFEPLGGLEVVHTPGHTPGSISLFSPSRKLLIVGDALNGNYRTLRLPPKMVSTDLAQAVSSVARIAQLDFDVICFGHGPPLTVNARAKVRKLIEKVRIDNSE